ncbi:MAG: hypothetical protein IKH02_04160 [Prevotella sp.]|nr:hypothetical protein [Prevotella sp.]MBR3088192.1 hypothetical protein [Prevotella sp.]
MEERKTTGILGPTLKQTYKQIKESRIEAMLEDAEMKYRREIEDVCAKIRQCDRDMEDTILDMLPSNAGQGINPSAFDADRLKNTRISTLIIRRENSVKLGILVNDYETLFGHYAELEKVRQYLPVEWKSNIMEG